MLRRAVEVASGGRSFYVRGIEITADEITEPDFLLPAVLVVSAINWAPAVITKGGTGGFRIHMESDEESILGYRVTRIEPSAPLLLLLPVVDMVIRSVEKGDDGSEVIEMDNTIKRFAYWLAANKLNTSAVLDIDLRVILSQTD